MSDTHTLPDWEKLVQKQLKTEDIYTILKKENLEGIEVKPFYDAVQKPLTNLPKVEESTHLVAPYHESLESDVFAFLLDQNLDLYGHQVTIEFAAHIRGMVAFTGIDPLIEQMHNDVHLTREILGMGK